MGVWKCVWGLYFKSGIGPEWPTFSKCWASASGRYIKQLSCGRASHLAQSVRPERRGLGEGTATLKGAASLRISGAHCSFTDMGHARAKRLAEKLLQIREALGLSQREMAERLGNYRTHHHISKYERGKAIPFMEVLLAYARVANVTFEQIVDDEMELCL